MRKILPLAAFLAATPWPGIGARASEGGSADPHFVAMEELKVPIIESDRVNGALRVKLVLEATDAAAADRLTARLPAVRAAALGAAIEFARLDASAMRAVDAERLDRDLTAAIGQGGAGVARVLIVEVAAERS